MCKNLIFLTTFFLALVLAGASTAFGVLSVDVRVAASTDDREEAAGSGTMDGATSSDLELGHEGAAGADTLQIVGVRFVGVNVPKDVKITNAWVQFTADDIDNPYHLLDVSVIVKGELSPNPLTFGSSARDISSRPTTTASVVWDIPLWGSVGAVSQTPDLSRVIQEIVEQAGWAAGNAMVLTFSDNPAKPSAGCREAEAWDGDQAGAPLLHIEYAVKYATDPVPADGGLGGPAPLLQWTAGATAVYHDVYFGTSPDLGPGDLMGRWTWPMYWHVPLFTPGTTYYWRVDEVEANGTTTHTGSVWTFMAVSSAAHSPNPPDGDKMAVPGVVLSWGSGVNAASHDVYFGASRTDVAAGTGGTFKGNQLEKTYTPEGLQDGTAYFWRIDEVEADGTTKHPGVVWSFRTRDDPALIGWWKFDEGEGGIAYDSSGYGNHGILGGNTTWVGGIMGGAIYLDGSDDYVSIDSIAPMMTHNNFTVSAWIKTDTLVDDHVVFGSNSGSSHNFLFGVMNGNVWVEDDTGTEFPPPVADNQWHMITYVRNGATSWIYVDGVLRKEDPAGDDPSADLRWSIGQEWDTSPSDEYQGLIDDARFWIRPLTAEEVAKVFKGDVELAHSPKPANGSAPDIEHVLPISWSAGENATRHDVYFGTDEIAVADATTSTTGIYRGRQTATTYTPTETLGWGTGPYYWRIDEVKADGTVSKGMVWSFSVGDFLTVDDFESYNDINENEAGSNRIYLTWSDGYGTTTNGAQVGNLNPPFAETRTPYVHSGGQAMPVLYDNNRKYSEATMALTGTARNWTRQSVANLSLWFRGDTGNTAERMYVSINGKAPVYHTNANATQLTSYTEWVIPLSTFTAQGTSLASVTSVAIGFGTPGNTTVAGGTGTVYIDDIRLYRP